MTNEEITAKRDLMRQRKVNAFRKISKLANLFNSANIVDWMVTGSQALIIHGFMFHRDGDDLDVRISLSDPQTPRGKDERERILNILKSWEMLYPKEMKNKKNYGKGENENMYTIILDGLKVNIFTVEENEYIQIPCGVAYGHSIEDVASVLFDKLQMERSKDYKDLSDCYISWIR